METLLIVLIILASILLVLLVLMQNPKGGGLSTDFGSAHQMGGVKQTNDFIEKATWSLAGIIGILSIAMTLMYHEPTAGPADAATQDTEQPAPAPAPEGGDAQ
ncbi:MAG TPA: preprotein translocase subunit SecG [Brumimicrobium sp.]|nr:preprotein translocase subunit SecG [Brumimicrobium sp.]